MVDVNFIESGADIAMSIIVPMIFIGVIAILGFFAYTTGLLTKRPYKCFIWTERAGKSTEIQIAKGRFLKSGDGKFEIFYGFNDKQIIEAPPEANIYPGNQLHFFRESRDGHFIMKVEKEETESEETVEKHGKLQSIGVNTNKTKMSGDPSWSNASKLALYQQLEKNAHRFGNNPWEKYAPYATLMIGFLIVAIAWYMGTNQIADSLNGVKDGFAGVAQSLADSQVIIDKTTTAVPGTPPTPGTPPG